ncbi:MAG: hypothetical protein RR985_05530 [Oscillospiraceae bacterium]
MINIKKVDENVICLLKQISLPVIFYEEPSFIHFQKKDELSKEEIKEKLLLMPCLLLELSKQFFYYNNIGSDIQTCTILHFYSNEFELIKDIIVQIFDHVSAFPVIIPPCNENVWQIQIQGISFLGLEMVKLLKKQGLLTAELTNLYINANYTNDYREDAFFSISNDSILQDEKCICAFFQQIFENKLIKSIDVSGLSIQQCYENELIRYAVNNKESVYLCVDEIPIVSESDSKFIKTLCWA